MRLRSDYEFSSVMKLSHFLNSTINSVMNKCYPAFWTYENSITDMLLMKFNELREIKISENHYSDYPIESKQSKISFSSYKFSGKTESNFGDIGILLSIRHENNTVIQGVAFLEAKKREKDSYTFPSFNFEQFNKIYSNTQLAQVLLYDFELNFAHKFKINYHRENISSLDLSYCLTVPMGLVNYINSNKRSIVNFGIPFASQIAQRYIWGLDLLYDRKLVNVVKGYDREQGAPNFVLKIDVAHGNTNYFEENQLSDNFQLIKQH